MALSYSIVRIHLAKLVVILFIFMLGENAMALTLSSSAFSANQPIPKPFTCDGEDKTPALSWEGAPEGTKGFALIMDDPDAPPGTWVHWVVYDIPATESQLPEGLPKGDSLPNGAKQGLVWGVNDFSKVGYHGPCPPPGNPHRYYFKLYALDQELKLPPRATKFDLEKAMKGHVLGETSLMGTYGR